MSSMLTPASASASNIRAVTPGCDFMPAPTSDTLPMWSSYSSCSKPTLALTRSSAAIAVGPSVLGRVKEMSVRPVAPETFCTTMSMLSSASAIVRKMWRRLARLVGHGDDGDLGLAAVVRDAGDDRLLHRDLRCCG